MNELVKFLEGYGFQLENGKYTLHTKGHMPGQVMIINGVRREDPGQEFELILMATVLDDAYYEDKPNDKLYNIYLESIEDQQYNSIIQYVDYDLDIVKQVVKNIFKL